jgi:tripartite-type tricarboxylate transporter receptor subunit TctC
MNRILLALWALAALAGPSAAQPYPTGPVTMVIPFAAGGPTDVLGRIVGENMSKSLGQPVVIENVGGAGGMVGSSRVAKGKNDGSQFVLGTVGTHAQNQTLYAKPQYDAVTDFDPVILIAEVPLVQVTNKDLPANNLQEFIAGCVLFNSMAGIAAMNDPDVRKRLGDLGAQIVSAERAAPDYLGAFVKSEIEKWAGPIKASGARVE